LLYFIAHVCVPLVGVFWRRASTIDVILLHVRSPIYHMSSVTSISAPGQVRRVRAICSVTGANNVPTDYAWRCPCQMTQECTTGHVKLNYLNTN